MLNHTNNLVDQTDLAIVWESHLAGTNFAVRKSAPTPFSALVDVASHTGFPVDPQLSRSNKPSTFTVVFMAFPDLLETMYWMVPNFLVLNAGNFREWSHSSLIIIITATPFPSIPYYISTSKPINPKKRVVLAVLPQQATVLPQQATIHMIHLRLFFIPGMGSGESPYDSCPKSRFYPS